MCESPRRPRAALTLALALLLPLAACRSTPPAPPVLDLPVASASADPSLVRWWQHFDDPTLDALIEEALTNNLDLRTAMVRVDLARAHVLLAQASLFPSLNLSVEPSRGRSTLAGWQPLPSGFNPTHNDYLVALRAAYEIDLWGRAGKSTDAARQELLASGYARETVRVAVGAETARAYFGLLAADAERTLQQETLQAREQTLALQQRLQQSGVIGDFDLQRAQAERAAVLANLAAAERAVGQYETALAAIVGRSPREVYEARIARDASPARLLAVPEIPADLPSDLLERRPDVRQAAAQLAAADLRIDAARAQYFPSLTLTASYGSESAALSKLFSAPALIWGAGASLLQPLIGLKAIDANVQAESARREAALLTYTQSVQSAFRETRDALIAHRQTRTTLAAQSERRRQLKNALELAELRYRAGYSGYLEVLDAQRQLLQAQSQEILAARDRRFALIELFKALGGGWENGLADVVKE